MDRVVKSFNPHDVIILTAIVGMVIALIMSIVYGEKDLGYVIAGALGGAISLKGGVSYGRDDSKVKIPD